MKIHLASDHAGWEYKEAIRNILQNNHEVVDHTPQFVPDDDYPDTITPAVRAITDDDVAIVFGGSGTGEAIVANRFSNARAVVYAGQDTDFIRVARTHNNANILSIGARFVSLAEASAAVEIFLRTDFPGEDRHLRRVQKLANL